VKHQFRGQQREGGKEREIWLQLGSKRVRERWDPNRRDQAWGNLQEEKRKRQGGRWESTSQQTWREREREKESCACV
jgi:hypothetical protein